MSLHTLRERLRAAREDDRITLAEVEALIRTTLADLSVNHQEALVLRAELEAHPSWFEPDALERLRSFLDQHEPGAQR